MDLKDSIYIGQIAKLHGYKGGVSLFLDVTHPEEYMEVESFFVDIEGILTPFFVESFKLKNKGFAAVKFQGVDSEEDAKSLIKKKIYLPEEELKELDESSFYDHEVIGYRVEDVFKGFIGTVVGVADLKLNPLLILEFNDKEILLPLFDGLIVNVDRETKQLKVQAPEGLIDLYLD
ncbi:ribosome maturation factor RimM [Crocinitomicaceae bacterium]|nr:ribosome maturation factor RimM [Crocinitomicaceae bacterium]